MGIFGTRRQRHGFTIAELLVVIAVIGILAAIVLVVYPGYQQRTRDNERKSDVQQIAAGIGAYLLQKNNYVESGSGCGKNGNGNGWFNASGSAGSDTYPASIASCLQNAKVLSGGAFVDPSGCTWVNGGSCGSPSGSQPYAYMKITCQKDGNKITYIMAHLETAAANNSAMDALCDSGTATNFTSDQRWGTTYGMNYYTVAK